MSNLKSFLFIDSSYNGIYGAPKSMLSLAKGLSSKGMKVTITSTGDGHLLNAASDLGLNKLIIKAPKILISSSSNYTFLNKFHFLLSLIYFWFYQLQFFNKVKSDHICINDIKSFLLFLPLLFLLKKKVYWYVRINIRISLVTKIALYLSEGISLVSNDCKGCFSKEEVLKYDHKMHIVKTGFEIQTLDRNNLNNGIKYLNDDLKSKFLFITVGSICRRKNQRDIVLAFHRLDIPNKHLIIVGSSPSDAENDYYDDLLELVDELSLSDNITFTGVVKDVDKYLAMSDIFLFASRAEGLPRSVIEAIFQGCYVVSSNVDGINDILLNQSVGLISKSRSDEKLFLDDFVKLINNIENLSINRDYISNYAANNFSYETFIKNYIAYAHSEAVSK